MNAPTRRPDASMTLLTEVMHRPLDPGYAAAAAAREQDPAPGRSRRRAPLTTVLAVLAGALLVVAVLDLRLPGLVDERRMLVDQVVARTSEVDALEVRVSALQVEVDAIGARVVEGGAVERVGLLGIPAGSVPVTGPGLEVVLDDAVAVQDPVTGDAREGGDPDEGRVLDRDLVTVVNGLWAAGAESISVNGQRLTSLSAIRAAGDAILVNFRALAPPYRITAVGDAQGMQTAFAASSAGRYLADISRNYGVRSSISARAELRLPAAQGLRLRYALEPDQASPAPAAPTDQEVAP